ncbi:MAG TPA: hypothetical protein VKZ53_04800 [Candidatus Angelobacter sp.]|nr:hypothetical protein [Candidatus Angelobacter sp.]
MFCTLLFAVLYFGASYREERESQSAACNSGVLATLRASSPSSHNLAYLIISGQKSLSSVNQPPRLFLKKLPGTEGFVSSTHLQLKSIKVSTAQELGILSSNHWSAPLDPHTTKYDFELRERGEQVKEQ